MPRRSKNSTDGAVFTYHERLKMDHGSLHRRLPGDAMKPWDRCALGLSRPKDPVVTPDGVLYEREAILRDLLRQRDEARQAQAEATRQREQKEGEELARKREADRADIERFEEAQREVVRGEGRPAAASDEGKQKRKAINADSNFWVPNIPVRLPASHEQLRASKKRARISLKTKCPISKKPLRSKDLISLRLTPNVVGREDGKEDKPNHADKYMCPVCQAVLVNAVKPIALRTGSVLCSRCVSQFVIKEGKDPCTSDNIHVDTDIIPIFNVGTAYAASAGDDPSSLEASVYRPSAT
ncbi:PREDICTED: nitric oxide synthase-interacting protein-like [Chondrus crispus]|uniref:PREDICTED: nitric oxide synthase-interacting protein-like n=1 Tax=Chondrus crispus TaxID=2769 RepID=R7Q7U4_CHOCR|nr:PREDICTED: nitric oxide synthase-interacting protein-like [Chondrus crispus]CDF34099.1 PREDICTED: nitric oxide synthase-interacting protein-like [Chondrus crispus]|eukprot:XP_005713918.1 PREDICTED: nitric oxide synthase-interacting protein-like [Chondrus crispus]